MTGVLKRGLDRVSPENLALEDAAEAARGDVEGVCHVWRGLSGGFELERGDTFVRDAAGDDPLEITKVCGDVEREAV